MAFEKGKSGNPSGRKKGSKNKLTVKAKDFVELIVEEYQDTIKEDFLKLEPKDRIMLFERFLQYVIPKAVKLETEGQTTITIEDKLKELSEPNK